MPYYADPYNGYPRRKRRTKVVAPLAGVAGLGAVGLGLGHKAIGKMKFAPSNEKALAALSDAKAKASLESSKKGLEGLTERLGKKTNYGFQKVRVGTRKNLSRIMEHIGKNPKTWIAGGLGTLGASMLF